MATPPVVMLLLTCGLDPAKIATGSTESGLSSTIFRPESTLFGWLGPSSYWIPRPRAGCEALPPDDREPTAPEPTEVAEEGGLLFQWRLGVGAASVPRASTVGV